MLPSKPGSGSCCSIRTIGIAIKFHYSVLGTDGIQDLFGLNTIGSADTRIECRTQHRVRELPVEGNEIGHQYAPYVVNENINTELSSMRP